MITILVAMLLKSLLLILAAMLASALVSCGKSSTEDYRAKARQYFAEEQFSKARENLGKVLNAQPSDREALYLMGMAYRKDQMYDSALSSLRRVNLLYPGDREICQNLYDVAVGLNDWPVARSALQGLINIGAPPPHANKLMADLWRRSDHPGNTYLFTQKALAEDSSDLDLWLQLANSAYMVESAEAALAYADSAIKRFGSSPMLEANRATYLSFAGKYDSAEAIFRELLVKDTGSSQLLLNLAHALASQKSKDKKREAIEYYRKVAPKVDSVFKVDSLIKNLEEELTK